MRTWTLRAAGTVALGAASHQVVTGIRGVRGLDHRQLSGATPNLDSEIRFYAVWYAAAGVLMHQAARDDRLDRKVSPLLAGAWSAAAASRLLSVRAVGRPSPLFLTLSALEVAVAGLLAATRPQPVTASCGRRPRYARR